MSNDQTDVVELHDIPIFRTGTYPQGTFDGEFVQTLADGYDPAFHEAPVVLTHEGQSPSPLAFGWVRRLYVKGDTLYADFAAVPRTFAELVLAGRVKKRSVEIYGELPGKGPYLRAVAWPLVPEVKALADVHPTQVFAETAEYQSIAFEELLAKETDMSEQTCAVNREDLEAMLSRLRDELLAEQRRILAELEVRNFCEQMVLAGKMTPAERTSEEPLLVEQRRRETAENFSEGAQRLSDQRLEHYRRRTAVVPIRTDEGAVDDAGTGPAPKDQKLLRYFHEHQAFFTRLGVSFDDLAAADRYESHEVNPLTQ